MIQLIRNSREDFQPSEGDKYAHLTKTHGQQYVESF